MADIKTKLKRAGFSAGMATLTMLPAKSAAQEFVYNHKNMQMEVARELIRPGITVENKSSDDKRIIFYDDAHLESRMIKNKKNGKKSTRNVLIRNLISIDDKKHPDIRETERGTGYELIKSAVKARGETKYIYNTDKLYNKYQKILYKHFPHLRNLSQDRMSICVTFSGPFELIEAIYGGDFFACVCRNGYDEKVLGTNREELIKLYMDPKSDLYFVKNGDSVQTFTARMTSIPMTGQKSR